MRVGRKQSSSPCVVALHGEATGHGWIWWRAAQPRGEEMGQAWSDQTKGFVPSKAKWPTSAWHETRTHWGSPFLCCQQISLKPAGETSCPTPTPIHKKSRHEVPVAVISYYGVWSKLAQIALLLTLPKGELLHHSGFLMLFKTAFGKEGLGWLFLAFSSESKCALI